MVETAILKLWLFRIYGQTPATYATLTLALAAAGNTSIDAVKGGTLASVGGNGHAVAWVTGGSSADASDFAEGISSLIDLYDSARADLITAGTASPTDAQIYAEMKFRLVPVRELTKDFSQANWRGA
jgi:hypothetical protein